MKVILTKSVKKLGQRHDVVDVANGYAQNFLIPQKLAVMATKDAEAQIMTLKSQFQAQRLSEKTDLTDMLNRVNDKAITITVKTNEKGGLYQSIDEHDIVDTLNKEFEVNIDADLVELAQPIKEVGEFPITLKLDETTAAVTLTIEAEEVEEQVGKTQVSGVRKKGKNVAQDDAEEMDSEETLIETETEIETEEVEKTEE